MAGGEFCGNAARAFGMLMAQRLGHGGGQGAGAAAALPHQGAGGGDLDQRGHSAPGCVQENDAVGFQVCFLLNSNPLLGRGLCISAPLYGAYQRIAGPDCQRAECYIATIKRLAVNEKLDLDTAKVLIAEYKRTRGKKEEL